MKVTQSVTVDNYANELMERETNSYHSLALCLLPAVTNSIMFVYLLKIPFFKLCLI